MAIILGRCLKFKCVQNKCVVVTVFFFFFFFVFTLVTGINQ